MPRDEFRALLAEQLDIVGNTIWRHHLRALEALRSELAEARRRLEEKDPGLWPVPEEPSPCSTSGQDSLAHAPPLAVAQAGRRQPARPTLFDDEASQYDYELVNLRQDHSVPRAQSSGTAMCSFSRRRPLDPRLDEDASPLLSRGGVAFCETGRCQPPCDECQEREKPVSGLCVDIPGKRKSDGQIVLKRQGSNSKLLPRPSRSDTVLETNVDRCPSNERSDAGSHTEDVAKTLSERQLRVTRLASEASDAASAVAYCQRCGHLSPESQASRMFPSEYMDAISVPESPGHFAGSSPTGAALAVSMQRRNGLSYTHSDQAVGRRKSDGHFDILNPPNHKSPTSPPLYWERCQSLDERQREESQRKAGKPENNPGEASQKQHAKNDNPRTGSEQSQEEEAEGVEILMSEVDRGSYGSVTALRFVARDVWCRGSKVRRHTVGALKSFRGKLNVASHCREETVRLPRRRWVRLVMLRPTSRVRMFWSLACLALLCYDIVLVPVDVFFALPEYSWIQKMEQISLSFWMCDIVMNFITGVQTHGVLEMRPWHVAANYMRGWFPLDTVLISSEWIVLYLLNWSSLEAISMLRAVRVLRLLRIIRLARFSRVFNDLMLFTPEPILLCLGFLKTVFSFAALIHVLACTWYFVGATEVLGRSLDDGLGDSELSVGHKYVYSVRWSVAQLHGISIFPLVTVSELLLASFCGVLGFIVMAVCVSKTAEALESAEEKHRAQMHRLCRHYLRSRNISAELTMRLRKYLGENDAPHGVLRLDILPRNFGNFNLREKVQHEELMVKELPLILQADLYEEVRRPLMETQKMYWDLGVVGQGSPVMRELCHKATRCEVALIEELVFAMGEVCTKTLVVETGKLIYVHGVLPEDVIEDTHTSVAGISCTVNTGNSSSPGTDMDDVIEIPVNRGRQISEAVLWTKWEHCGALVAHANCTMLALDAGQFARVVLNHDAVLVKARRYVSHMMAWMNTLEDEEAFSDLLEIPHEIVSAQALNHRRNPREHLIFISHYKKEAGTEATLIEEGFQRLIHVDHLHPANDFRRPIFLDSQDMVDLKSLERYVRRSHNLMILLTPEVLTRPYCLLEIVTALKYGIEIVPVKVDRPGLSFSIPEDAWWKDLTEGKVLPKEDEDLLKSRGVELHQLKDVRKVFDKIALPFSPHKTLKIREAELKDILARCVVREAVVGLVPGSSKGQLVPVNSTPSSTGAR